MTIRPAVRPVEGMENDTMGGSAETEATLDAVSPTHPSAVIAVMTETLAE